MSFLLFHFTGIYRIKEFTGMKLFHNKKKLKNEEEKTY